LRGDPRQRNEGRRGLAGAGAMTSLGGALRRLFPAAAPIVAVVGRTRHEPADVATILLTPEGEARRAAVSRRSRTAEVGGRIALSRTRFVDCASFQSWARGSPHPTGPAAMARRLPYRRRRCQRCVRTWGGGTNEPAHPRRAVEAARGPFAPGLGPAHPQPLGEDERPARHPDREAPGALRMQPR